MRWVLSMLVAVAAAAPVAGGAVEANAPAAAEGAGCDAFAWPVANESRWFAQEDLRRGASGVRLSRIDRAVDLTLEPTTSARFFLPPGKAPRPDSYSGDVTFFGVPHRGVYQISISGDADIDVFENGTRLRRMAASEAKGCRSVRRSERYALAPGDLVLVQITGALQPSIKVALAEAPNQR